jgi:hypothetical protein
MGPIDTLLLDTFTAAALTAPNLYRLILGSIFKTNHHICSNNNPLAKKVLQAGGVAEPEPHHFGRVGAVM